MSPLQRAIESYAFDIIQLGARIPANSQGVSRLQDRIQNAFQDELGSTKVGVYLNFSNNDIEINLIREEQQ